MDLSKVDSVKEPLRMQKGDRLFEQGTPVRGIYCNGNGLLKVLQTGQNGKVKFSRLVFPGDSAGHRSLFVAENYKGTAAVVSDSIDVCFISISDILSLFAESKVFARSLLGKLARELDRSVDEQIQLKEVSSFARLCQLLEALFSQFGESHEGFVRLRTALSKVDIARVLAVADETVIRWMADLKNEKIVELRDRRLVLLDRKRLRFYASSGLEPAAAAKG